MFRRIIFVLEDVKLIEGRLKMASFHTSSSRDNKLLDHRKTTYQPVTDFYAGKSVLITGGAGFLGKVFIERLLYNCTEIDKIFVILREKKDLNIKQRLQDIKDNPLFTKLKETRPSDLNKIVPIKGDMESQNLGITSDDQRTILENVSVVFHSAAEIRFHKPLKHTLKVNVEGTRELLNLCSQMKKIEAFVHVSTAYSQAERKLIDEIVYPPPHQLSQVYELLENKNSPKELKQILKGKLSTYTYSKAMAEALVAEEHGHIPKIIVRPSLVGAVKDEPLPGWLDNWNGSTGLLYDFGRGVNKFYHGQRDTVTDMIPVDYTVNLSIVAATRCSDKEVKVYNSCTSLDNPVTSGYLAAKCREIYKELNNDNSTSKVYFLRSSWMVSVLSGLYQLAPAYAADFWLKCKGREARYVKELKPAILRRNLLKDYTSISMFWKTNNTRNLYATLSQQDQQQFPFDPTNISWDKYLEDNIKGINEYLMVKKQ